MITILIHGFNVWDGGRSTIGKLRPFFINRQIPPVMVNYGWFGLGRTYLKNHKVARRVAEACRVARLSGQPVIVVGHSNGCAIAHIAASRYGAKIDKLVYINPALNKNTPLSDSVDQLDVWHSPSDKPVKWSRWLPLHPWGEMGATGYKGINDDRVRNFNKEVDFPVVSNAHSDVFDVRKLLYFGPLIVDTAMNAA